MRWISLGSLVRTGVWVWCLGTACVLSHRLATASPAKAPADPHAATTAGAGSDQAPAHRRCILPEPVVVIGASVSEGFGTFITPPPGEASTQIIQQVPTPLGAVVAAVTGCARPPQMSSAFFFANPNLAATQQVEFALERSPRLVFAIDYLFWHAYGIMPETQRSTMLEEGLSRLDTLPGTIVIADLPDMSHAVGVMLAPRQVPKPSTLAALNERLEAWARERPRVVIVPLREVVQEAMAQRKVTLGGATYEGEAARALLAEDGLHASVSGVLAFVQEIMLKLQDKGVVAPGATWERRDAELRSALWSALVPAPAAEPVQPAPKADTPSQPR